jgi:hypothetical protein
MRHFGVERMRVYRCATNGRVPWWNAGAIRAAVSVRWLHHPGVVKLFRKYRRLAGAGGERRY